MTPFAAKTVAEQLLQLAAEGLIVTIGVTLCFSLALVGTVRAGDARRDGRNARLVSWSLLAAICFVAFAGFVVLGIAVVTHKS